MINIPVQTLGGSVAVIVWWLFGVLEPNIKVSSEVVAASVVVWQMIVGLFALLLQRAFGRDTIYLDTGERRRSDDN